MRAFLRLLALAWLVLPQAAAAGGLDPDITGPRGVGRAGAVLVSDDGGAALVLNPAGLARREAWRAQVGVRMDDADISFRAAHAPDAPVIEDRAAATHMPQIGLQGALGPFVVGAAYLEASTGHTLPRPPQGQLAADVTRLYPHRYSGTSLRYQRRMLLAGAAVRAQPWLGLGLSMSAARVTLEERRHVWAGLADSETVGEPAHDLALTLRGRAGFVPGFHAGVLVAPPALPVEAAFSMSYTRNERLSGDVLLERTRQVERPAPEIVPGGGHGEVVLVNPLVVRAGLRYLGDRVLLEVGAELAVRPDAAPVWSVSGVQVRHHSELVRELVSVPSLLSTRDHGAVRAAMDIEAVPGFLWLSAGYAYHGGASPPASITPVFASLGSHTIALGAEAQWSGTTLTLGYARTLMPARDLLASEVMLVNPLDGGSMLVGAGSYAGSRDLVGVVLEVAWE